MGLAQLWQSAYFCDLGGERVVTSVGIPNQSAVSTVDGVFPNDLFSDYSEITAAVVVSSNVHIHAVLFVLHFLVV